MLYAKYHKPSKLKEVLMELFSKWSIRSIMQRLYYYRSNQCTYFLCTTSNDASLIEYHANNHHIVSTELKLNDLIQKHEKTTSNFVVLGSCNDLILGEDRVSKSLLLVNPFTQDYLILDCGLVIEQGSSTRYEFGYSPYTGQYKVLRFKIDTISRVFTVDILTIDGTNNWRTINCYKNELLGQLSYLVDPTVLNGSIHWLVSNKNKIVRFDIDTEEFELVPMPQDKGLIIGQLSAIGESISVLACHEMCESDRVEVWVMKEYGREDSWTRVSIIHDFNIDLSLKLIHVSNDGKFLFQRSNRLCLYDPIEEKWDEEVARVAMKNPVINHLMLNSNR